MEDSLKLQPLEILQRAVPLRDHFLRRAIGGSIVGVAQSSTLETLTTLFALWATGATTWLCPLREPSSKLKLLSDHIGAELLLGTREFSHVGTVAQAEQLLADMLGSTARTLINTSGSTGLPKFVEHALSQHFLSAQGVNEVMHFDSESNWLLSLPVYHVGGLAIVIRAIAASANLTIPEAGQRAEDALRSEEITHMSLVATQLRKWIGDPELFERMKRAKRVILGGGPVPSWLSEVSVQNGLPIVASYGATEMASMWTAGGNSSGKLLPTRELKINSQGEVLVRGPMLFRRYYGQDANPFDADGFYRSSDLGHLDNEGNLTILGRKDNMFISGGENIHPQEIELSLLNHPKVEAAHVVAVPDEKWGKRPLAYVRMADQESICETDLREHLKKSLPSFKIPDQFLSWRGDIRQKGDVLAQA